MKKHASVIHFRSEGLGKGTTFFFVLPLYALHRHNLKDLPRRSVSNPAPSKYSNISPARVFSAMDPDKLDVMVAARSFATTPASCSGGGLTVATTSSSPSSMRRVDLKVLAVDDSKANLKFLVRHLRQAESQLFQFQFQLQQPLQVVVALELVEELDGTAAVASVDAAAVQGRPFQMIFMDNIMKEMHGPEAARCMRQNGFTGLIVGVTGNVMQKDVDEYIQAGANHIMPKPITTAHVAGMIQRMVSRVMSEEDSKGDD